ncbi:phosphoadenylyl-sulfate reductase [Corynebacterium uberis]|uniref:phosphoadenylyl-sulfate reductase n=1 Tax=Corynebacterium uberis TaxID=2883169 RepID=UPI001D0AB271|nr:phosphoadenylyl-sulfate reductase [Corynebacterium uberis]UDL77879.1 phosphoadenylyl-sulfate reductase [Corynebacterium uberis]
MSNVDLLGAGAHWTDPAISPPGTRDTAPLPPQVAQANRALVDTWADRLSNDPAAEIIAWAAEHAPGRLAVTMSMENTVLAELAHDAHLDADLLFIDTGFHFPETLDTAAKVERRYPDLPLVRVTPLLTPKEQDRVYGPRLYARDTAAYNRMRKVEPLNMAMDPYAGWVTGLRRADSAHRAHTPALSLDRTGRLKISPLVTWTLEDTDRFIAERDLIIHPLTLQGYRSIGCAPLTFPVAEGADARSGRVFADGHTECGLHP